MQPELLKGARHLRGLEIELERCQEAFPHRFHPVHILMPEMNNGKTSYAGLCFRVPESYINLIKREILKINRNMVVPGTIAMYRAHQLDSRHFIEIRPYMITTFQNLIAHSEIIARYFAKVLENLYR